MPKPNNPRVLPAIHPNAGLTVAYQRRLDRLIGEMHNSVLHWVSVAYRASPPEMAADASPAATLRATMRGLASRWNKRFRTASQELAEYFATSAADRADGALKDILKRAGFSVQFTMTPAANDVLQATIGEQVSLIRSISSEYLSDVEGLVMRSVAEGRDLKTLVDQIGPKVDLALIGKGQRPGESDKSLIARTRRRAELIARDQNNKATATITRARYQSIGITEAIWMHSGGGRHPRPEHLKAGREKLVYDVQKGAYLEGKWVLPGTEINCRCTCRPILPGLAGKTAKEKA